MKVEIKEIPGYEGLYMCTEEGDIFSVKWGRKRKLKPWKNDNSYLRVNLRKDGKSKGKMVHRLVLETFVGSGVGFDGDHIDGHKDNNRLSNLRWLTHAQNMIEASNLPVYQARKKAVIGTHVKTGEVVKFESISSARKAGCGGAISDACRGLRPTSGGYRWRYAG